MNRAIFIDKDGTLVEDAPFNVDPAKVQFVEGAFQTLRTLALRGYKIVVVSNQSGVAFGKFDHERLAVLITSMKARLLHEGVPLTDFQYCPHHPEGVVDPFSRDCECRKPKAGMLFEAARRHQIDLKRSWMVGDILDDVEAGKSAGCRTILVDRGNESVWNLGSAARIPDFIVSSIQGVEAIIARDDGDRAIDGAQVW